MDANTYYSTEFPCVKSDKPKNVTLADCEICKYWETCECYINMVNDLSSD